MSSCGSNEPHPSGPPSSTTSYAVERATEVLTAWARERGFDLSGGLESIRLVPESVHVGFLGYGTRTGTWAEIGDFVAMWTRQGGSWVNVGWDYDEQGRPILTYASQWRMGDPEEPRENGRAPDINLHGPPTTGPRAPGSAPRAEAYARVIQQLSTVTPVLAERLDGRLDLTGPFSGLSDLDEDSRLAFSLARRALEERLREIAPEAFAPDPTLHDMPVIAGEPWIYLEWALGGKISAIAGRDVFGPAEVEPRERAWRRLFG